MILKSQFEEVQLWSVYLFFMFFLIGLFCSQILLIFQFGMFNFCTLSKLMNANL
jgi:hypothetical protein